MASSSSPPSVWIDEIRTAVSHLSMGRPDLALKLFDRKRGYAALWKLLSVFHPTWTVVRKFGDLEEVILDGREARDLVETESEKSTRLLALLCRLPEDEVLLRICNPSYIRHIPTKVASLVRFCIRLIDKILAHIPALPNELLLLIGHHVVHSSTPADSDLLIPFLAVSKDWRELFLSASSLWGFFVFSMDGRSNRDKWHAGRGKGAVQELSVFLDYDHGKDDFPADANRTVLEPIIEQVGRDNKRLERVTLFNDHADVVLTLADVWTAAGSPSTSKLKRVFFERASDHMDLLPFAAPPAQLPLLTSLELVSIRFLNDATFFPLLLLLPNLVDLKLYHSSPLINPSLDEASTLSLLNLKLLVVRTRAWTSYTDQPPFLLDAPQLEEMDICGDLVKLYLPKARPPNNLPSLRTLRLINDTGESDIPVHLFETLLRAHPSITSLAVHQMNKPMFSLLVDGLAPTVQILRLQLLIGEETLDADIRRLVEARKRTAHRIEVLRLGQDHRSSRGIKAASAETIEWLKGQEDLLEILDVLDNMFGWEDEEGKEWRREGMERDLVR